MISIVMMALGAFRFGMRRPAHQELARSAGYRWSGVDRIGRAPALQYAGPGTEELKLEGVIYPHYKGGLHQIDGMRAQAGLGLPMMMVDGMGWVWDFWVITGVEERKRYLMSDGAPREITFTLSLKQYGGDLL